MSRESITNTLKKLQYILGLGVIASVLIAAPAVFAESGTGNSSTGTATSTPPQQPSNSASSDSSNTDQPLTTAQKTELQNRLAKQQTDLKIKLTDAESKKLKLKCQPAQAVVKNVETKVETNVSTRTKAYQDVNDKLTAIIAKLQAKQIDTTELKSELTVLQGKVATFNTDLTAAKQAMSDARNVDCISDPTAFETALQTARTARDKVIKDAGDIKSYVTTTIKPSLEKVRQQLAAQEKNSNNDSSQQGGSNQ